MNPGRFTDFPARTVSSDERARPFPRLFAWQRRRKPVEQHQLTEFVFSICPIDMFYLLTLLVAASRFLPHPPNVACLGALGLFAGCYMVGRRAYLVPIAVLLLSDIVGHLLGVPGMGFYNPLTMMMVYAGALAAVPIGRWMASNQKWMRFPVGSLAASCCFFLLSNFGVWLGGWYAMTGAGLLACYTNAIPFFGYTAIGDLLFTAILFGCWQWSRQGELLPNSKQLAPVPATS